MTRLLSADHVAGVAVLCAASLLLAGQRPIRFGADPPPFATAVALAESDRGETVEQEDRTYHKVDVDKLHLTSWTHVEVTARVVLVRREPDGDWHIGLVSPTCEADKKPCPRVVAEQIPNMLVDYDAAAVAKCNEKRPETPCVGWLVRYWGVQRIDRRHRWAEVHPAEGWRRLATLPAPK